MQDRKIRKFLREKTIAELYEIAAVMDLHADTLLKFRRDRKKKVRPRTREKMERYIEQHVET